MQRGDERFDADAIDTLNVEHSADVAQQAVTVALANAAPLKYNSTKIDMAKGLLASGLTKLAEVRATA